MTIPITIIFVMKPHFAPHDAAMFERYLAQTSVYFEFGSGGSTCSANARDNVKRIYTVESDPEWLRRVHALVDPLKCVLIYSDMDTQRNDWGNPGPKCTDAQKSAYSDQIRNLSRSAAHKIDMVLIDGRFRISCCLKCFDTLSDDAVICFDDFLNRPGYHVVLQFFEIIEQTQDLRMVMLRKKKGIAEVPEQLLRKYEYVKG